jgi:hypothetical protein
MIVLTKAVLLSGSGVLTVFSLKFVVMSSALIFKPLIALSKSVFWDEISPF